MRVHSRNSPKVLIHGLEEELIVGLIEDLFKVQQCDLLRGDGDLHQVRRLLLVDMIDYFGFRHFLCSFSLRRSDQTNFPGGLVEDQLKQTRFYDTNDLSVFFAIIFHVRGKRSYYLLHSMFSCRPPFVVVKSPRYSYIHSAPKLFQRAPVQCGWGRRGKANAAL